MTAFRIAAALLSLASLGPAIADEPFTALVGATIHPVNGPTIEDGVLVMQGGRIVTVGGKELLPTQAAVIDASGKHVYPGLIAPYTQLGLVEIGAVRATLDTDEAGSLNPNALAHKAFNPDSELIRVTRSNGVLLAVTAPTGGRMPGCSSLMQLDGWTWEDMLVEPAIGLHLNWPRTKRLDHDEEEEDHDKPEPDEHQELEELFDQAEAYAAEHRVDPNSNGFDLRLSSLGPVIRGKRPLIVAAEAQAEIEAAVAFCARRGLKMILHGGYDAPRCAQMLIANDVPVIVRGVYRLPRRRHEPYDHAYTLPARLHEAGVTFCLAGTRHGESWNARNLPYHAAVATGFGLPADEALKAITLNAARVLGVDDRLGSLEAGKQATLIITDGDPLETTSHVLRAFVQGREVDLSDRQKQLNERFGKRTVTPSQAN